MPSNTSTVPLRFLVFGATGRTGIVFVQQALQKGHNVTAFVRNPSKFLQEIDSNDSRLQIVKGDIYDAAEVERVIAAQKPHVVYGMLTSDYAPHNAVSTCAKNAVEALQRLKQSGNVDVDIAKDSSSSYDTSKVRFIQIGAVGLSDTKKNIGFWTNAMFQSLLTLSFMRKSVEDQELSVSFLESSRQPFSVLCPVFLTNGPLTRNYQSGEAIKPNDIRVYHSISRRDLADLALRLGEESWSSSAEGKAETIPNYVYAHY